MAFFHLYTIAAPTTEVEVSCAVSVEMPPEIGDINQHYVVKLDNGQYVTGTFVDPTKLVNLSIVTINLIIDGSDVAGLLHEFFIDNPSFYLKCDYLDLFLEGTNGIKHKVKMREFQINGRQEQYVWTATLTVEKDD